MTKTCETCRFWHKAEPQYVYGDCHRMPPQFNFSANFTEEGYGAKRYKVEISRFQNAAWPNVHQDEFCGEHRPAITSTNESGN